MAERLSATPAALALIEKLMVKLYSTNQVVAAKVAVHCACPPMNLESARLTLN
jgi:hypothetical protein